MESTLVINDLTGDLESVKVKNKLGIYKIFADVQTPSFATEQSACFDLRLYLSNDDPIEMWTNNNEKLDYHYGDANDLTILPGHRYKLPTGLILDIPEGYHVEINVRSGTGLKKGLSMVNDTGIVDSDYVQEVFVLLQNNSKSIVVLENGERFAQARLVRNTPVDLEILKNAPERKTSRDGGFNSTGLR